MCAAEKKAAPEGADAARLAKVTGGRRKILDKAMRKYCFKMLSRLAPQAPIVEDDRLDFEKVSAAASPA